MSANRNFVEHVVTQELNGRELGMTSDQLQAEARHALSGRSAHETNENIRMYNQIAARDHLPQLALTNEHGGPQHGGQSHERRPHARPANNQELPVPPIPPGAPGSEAPITPPAAEQYHPPTYTPERSDAPQVNEPGAVNYRDNHGILSSEGALKPLVTRTGESQYNPLNLPGLDITSTSGVSPRLEHQNNGETTARYAGNAGLLTADMTYNSERTTDAQGHILHERVDYNGQGDILVQGPNGHTQQLHNLRSAETTYNPGSNQYTTDYVGQDGTHHRSTTGGDGKVLSFT